ncbi:ATP phosphoribosyltransferase regulatory subunit [Moorena sp. SIO4G3]|uniref:ATP phosphoribosyltransferase regulatory subunit n=1 Tax=Moorena sp. SIO4G3 TaxID=2607821 RepID=UPI00142C21CA|nr:ATP phosphoribosyltransferase regulatory subunit [Moorena sp. SIO4G3]NEO75008.1 ATP phosphoribosyltransferase regulatory subunit [Moorena sp. SIO4G3]
MIHQPPPGARDLLPLEVTQKRWIANHLQQVFHRWSYHRIITSTLEWLDTLMAGGAVERSTVIQLHDAEEGTLGLRPELTASIARAMVSRIAGSNSEACLSLPQRLYYNANVFRRPTIGHHGRQLEFYQSGVELLGVGGLLADGEILLLLADCLNHLGLQQWHLILGEARLTRSLLSPFPKPMQEKVRQAIAYLDRVSLETLPLSPELRERALFLFDLRGDPADVLQKVASLDLDSSEHEIVTNLKSLVELLNSSSASPLPIVLDLTLVQTFDYYTGIVFEVVSSSEGSSRVLGQGGRYDQLLSLYHPQGENYPGIGFCLNLEDLHYVLLSSNQLPSRTPASDWLVVPELPEAEAIAFTYAQKLRDSEDLVRVEIELGGRSPAQIREYALGHGITYIAWVPADGTPRIETLTKKV